jgi:hypothetical protein
MICYPERIFLFVKFCNLIASFDPVEPALACQRVPGWLRSLASAAVSLLFAMACGMMQVSGAVSACGGLDGLAPAGTLALVVGGGVGFLRVYNELWCFGNFRRCEGAVEDAFLPDWWYSVRRLGGRDRGHG